MTIANFGPARSSIARFSKPSRTLRAAARWPQAAILDRFSPREILNAAGTEKRFFALTEQKNDANMQPISLPFHCKPYTETSKHGDTMIRSYIFILLGLLCLASCGPDAQTVAAQKYQTMTMTCAAQYPDQPPTMAAFQRCKNAAADATVGQFEPYPDLYQLAQAGRVEIADQADEGQITLDQANADMAQLNAQIAQAVEDRNNQKTELAAQSLSAISNYLAAQKALDTPPVQPNFFPIPPTIVQPTPVPPTITTNCTSFGNLINCMSH